MARGTVIFAVSLTFRREKPGRVALCLLPAIDNMGELKVIYVSDALLNLFIDRSFLVHLYRTGTLILLSCRFCDTNAVLCLFPRMSRQFTPQ